MIGQGRSIASLGAVALLALAPAAVAQAVYVCEGDGRSFAVAGAGGAPPGCRELADPVQELSLAGPLPDIEALSREVASLAERVARLEALLGRPVPRTGRLAPPARRTDPTDSRGRMRDLGQDIDRQLDGLGR
jgi:hypothetical protein